MRAEPQSRSSNSFGRLRFSEKVERILALPRTAPLVSRRASDAEIETVLEKAGRLFPVAPLSSVQRMRERNPAIVQVLEGPSDRDDPTIIAYLPLSDEGARRLLDGTLNGRDPDPELIVAEHETPAAVYIWMTWTPGRLARTLPAMAQIFSNLAPEGCALFSRAVTEHAERLNKAMGFVPARDVFPDAPEGLLVVLPEREMARVHQPMPKIEVRPVRSFDDMAKIFAIRSATYICEQSCLYDEEFDGNDFCATHLLGVIDGDPAGCVRMRYFGDFVKVERLAVRREYRKSRLAFKLVREAIALARQKGFKRIYGHARLDLVPFWGMFGARVLPDSDIFKFADVEYREMVIDLDAHAHPIGLGDDPMVTIRPEGAWNVPGPLELSNLRPSRAAFFQDMRTIGRSAH